MKKLTQTVSVFIATTILLQSAFCWVIVFFVWKQNKYYQKEKIERNIPIEKLTAISFKKNKNAVRINENEIELNGEWYDVVCKSGKGESEILYCISDKKESEIMFSLEKKKNNNSQQGLVSFMKSLNKEYPPTKISFFISKNSSEKVFNSISEKKILSGYQSIIYTPPDFIV